MAHCGARTREGISCGNLVPHEGLRCFRHEGIEEAGQRLAVHLARREHRPGTRAASSTRWWELHAQDRVESAVESSLRLVTSEQWRDAIASRVAHYASDNTWQALLTSVRRDHCVEFAAMATHILATRRLWRSLTRSIAVLFGVGRVERRFAAEVAKKLQLRTDLKPIAVARGLQATGVLLCLANGRDLGECRCFVDLARTELKERVRQILIVATHDWGNLARFPAHTPKGFIRPMQPGQNGGPPPTGTRGNGVPAPRGTGTPHSHAIRRRPRP